MMLLDLVCGPCVLLQLQKGLDGAPTDINVPVKELNQSGVYEVKCTLGHKSTNVINNIDFEMLFEYGVNALADSYYRDAVASFASALERYFEFFIKAALHTRQADFTVINKGWKAIAGQSERQLGAYTMLYTQLFGQEAPLLNANKEVPFRNSVIHKGHIPSQEEAIRFGDKVLELIDTSLNQLRGAYPLITEETFAYYGYAHQHNISHTNAENEAPSSSEDITQEDKIATYRISDPLTIVVNILASVTVTQGVLRDESGNGNIEFQIDRVLNHREPRRLLLFKELPKEYRDAE
jgi:hypothetical protein